MAQAGADEASVRASRASEYLEALCYAFPDRHVGGPGNEAANTLFERVVSAAGFTVRSIPFDCVEWIPGEVELEVSCERFRAHPGPYSLACDVSAPLRVAGTIDELESGSFAGAVLLLVGDLAREQLMPKNFDFYNPDEHKRIVAALERQAPSAVLGATGRNPSLAGALYPFPLLEDGDFDIPNAYLTDVDGEELATHAGDVVRLRIASGRRPATARQLIASKAGTGPGRIVMSAHIDSKEQTPGALDNATGVAALMLTAHLLRDYEGSLSVELVPFNGEDYYSAPGQKLYLEEQHAGLHDIVLEMNLDGAGFAGKGTAVSFYGCPEPVLSAARSVLAHHPGLTEGAQWYQGDHSIFAMQGIPALAVTSENFLELSTDYTHTARDRTELVDPALVVEIADFLEETVRELAVAVIPVRAFGFLHEYRRQRGLPSVMTVAIPSQGTTGRALALDLDVPIQLIEGVFVNGTVYGIDHEISRGDRVAFVPQGTPGPHRYFLGLYRAGQESKSSEGLPEDGREG